MKNVLVVGVSSKSAGGLSVLSNFLNCLKDEKTKYLFIVAVPSKKLYKKYESENIKIINFGFLSHKYILPLTFVFILPIYAKLKKINYILNFADIPLNSNIRQSLLFDWPHVVYGESIKYLHFSLTEHISHLIKSFFFKKYINRVELFMCQNSALEKRLIDLYNVNRTIVIPNAFSIANNESDNKTILNVSNKFKILCLSKYYPHKNLEVIIPVALELKRKKIFNVEIHLTIDYRESTKTKKLIDLIHYYNLDDIIKNLGTIPFDAVPNVFKNSSALLLPSFFESYSGTYSEALYYRKPILTSKLDFATSILQDVPYYFDPFNPISIVIQIIELINDKTTRDKKIEEGTILLKKMPSWQEVTKKYLNTIDEYN